MVTRDALLNYFRRSPQTSQYRNSIISFAISSAIVFGDLGISLLYALRMQSQCEKYIYFMFCIYIMEVMKKRVPLSVTEETYVMLKKRAEIASKEKDMTVSISELIRMLVKESLENLEQSNVSN